MSFTPSLGRLIGAASASFVGGAVVGGVATGRRSDRKATREHQGEKEGRERKKGRFAIGLDGIVRHAQQLRCLRPQLSAPPPPPLPLPSRPSPPPIPTAASSGTASPPRWAPPSPSATPTTACSTTRRGGRRSGWRSTCTGTRLSRKRRERKGASERERPVFTNLICSSYPPSLPPSLSAFR